MRRANDKVSEAIRLGKPPLKRRRTRIINLATLPVDLTEEEQIAEIERGRSRIGELGYSVDTFGRLMR